VRVLEVILSELSFRQAVLFYPVATVLHVLEEWPSFPRWARRFASSAYSDGEYVVTHVLTILLAVATTALVGCFPRPWLVFGFFALVFGPAVSCNGLFHAGASIASRAYCPGTLTGLALYLPLSSTLIALALREGLVSGRTLLVALCFAVLVHTAEVGHNVFKRW
jgi:uncharacterized protein with HXXEE motif